MTHPTCDDNDEFDFDDDHHHPCIRQGCGQPTWNGKEGEYCSYSCRDMGKPRCIRPGCGRSTWNGKKHEYCSRSCRDMRNQKKNVPCARNGCPCNSWNGQPREFCCRTCKGGKACKRKFHL